MKNILIITPGILPVPATKGGAVEALIQSYITENEKEKRANLYVYTIFDKNSYNFKNTQLVYIDNTRISYKINRIIRYFINNKLPKIHVGNAYITHVIKKLKKDKTKYDVIVVENNPFAVLKLRKIFPNEKIILHLHNDFLNSNVKYAAKIVDSYNKIITISNYLKERVETIKKVDKIEIVYNGLDVDMFSKKVDECEIKKYKKLYNIKENDIVLLYVGRLIKEKGIKELLIATNNLVEDNRNIKLLIVGSKASIDSKKDAFIRDLNRLSNKYKKNIIFTGFIKYKKLPILYQMADIQLIPSNWGEPLGNVVIEGLASGIKQIVTNDGGIPEIAGPNTNIINKNNLEQNLYREINKVIKDKSYKQKYNNDVKKFKEKEYANNCFKVFNE